MLKLHQTLPAFSSAPKSVFRFKLTGSKAVSRIPCPPGDEIQDGADAGGGQPGGVIVDRAVGGITRPPPVLNPELFPNEEVVYVASCPEGYTGDDVVITIPAGTYTSPIPGRATVLAMRDAVRQAVALLECEPEDVQVFPALFRFECENFETVENFVTTESEDGEFPFNPNEQTFEQAYLAARASLEAEALGELNCNEEVCDFLPGMSGEEFPEESVQVEGSEFSGYVTSTSVTVSVPAEAQDGDTLLVVLMRRSTITGGLDGWTLIAEQKTSAAGGTEIDSWASIYRLDVEGAPSASVTPVQASSGRMAAYCLALRVNGEGDLEVDDSALGTYGPNSLNPGFHPIPAAVSSGPGRVGLVVSSCVAANVGNTEYSLAAPYTMHADAVIAAHRLLVGTVNLETGESTTDDVSTSTHGVNLHEGAEISMVFKSSIEPVTPPDPGIQVEASLPFETQCVGGTWFSEPVLGLDDRWTVNQNPEGWPDE